MQASLDFQWDAARVTLHRQNPYELALTGGTPAPADALPDRFEPNQVPSVLMLLWPYALLAWPVAKVAWAISNLIFTGVIGWVLMQLYPLPAKAWTVSLVGL